MSDQFVGEIRFFAGTFAPTGWAFCNGQILSIIQNTALFSLLGTQFGGDGKSTFALPNFQGRVPIGVGTDSEGNIYDMGQSGGSETVPLSGAQLPVHKHAWPVGGAGTAGQEKGGQANSALGGGYLAYSDQSTGVTLSPSTIGPATAITEHSNMAPYLAINFIIALQGIFPPRG